MTRADSAALAILFIGPISGTSQHRQDAFRRLGHSVSVIEPRKWLPSSPWIDRFEWHVSPAVLGALVERRLAAWLAVRPRFDLVFVDGGSLVTASAVRLLKRHARFVASFNHDDPFGHRDGARFTAYRKAVPEYDLVTVVRPPNVDEAKAHGARDVLLHPMVSDEVAHAPRAMTPEQSRQWSSEVAFVGSWMPERGPFMLDLVERGVPLAIFGPRWNKAPEWEKLRPFHRADYVDGEDYAHAVQGARISLGLLSKGNRDEHTTRSMEIPALGGLLCAERTTEHARFYEEDVEAVFWADSAECAQVCQRLLSDEPQRAAVARQGRERAARNGFTSEQLICRMIDRLEQRGR
ncbi:MAG: glycosyltransferase family 1 protein [Rhizobacter sp.]|nr:glycosyltransferase family 1 protein [Rhizobacter sp.]